MLLLGSSMRHLQQPGGGLVRDRGAVGQVALRGNEVEVGQRIGDVGAAQDQPVHQFMLGGAELPGEPGTERVADQVQPAGRVTVAQGTGAGVERDLQQVRADPAGGVGVHVLGGAAAAVAGQVHGDDAAAGLQQGADPAGVLPVELGGGGKTVQQQDRPQPGVGLRLMHPHIQLGVGALDGVRMLFAGVSAAHGVSPHQVRRSGGPGALVPLPSGPCPRCRRCCPAPQTQSGARRH